MNRLKTLLVLFACSCILLAVPASADNASYNTSNDPLVSLSYVNDVLKPAIISDTIKQMTTLYPQLENLGSIASSNSEFEVVHITAGQFLMADGTCELLMTVGKAVVVINKQENIDAGVGLNDLTAAKRLLNGEEFPRDHYVLIPRGDGRGIMVSSEEAYFMVRGEYSVVTY